jgi:hypothetical protein
MKKQNPAKGKPMESKGSRIDLPWSTVLNWATPVWVIVFAWYMTMGLNPDFLWKLQDLDLFVMNKQFLIDNLQKVGGLSMYAGSFLTQFFYQPWIGFVIYLMLMLLIGFLTAKAFGLKKSSFPLAFLPSLAILLCMTEMGYMVYLNKVDGYVFDILLSTIVPVLGFWAYRSIADTRFKLLFSLAFLLVGYPMVGVYALFGALLMLLHTVLNLKKGNRRAAFVAISVLTASILIIPIGYYWFAYDQIAFGDIYTANLPNFTFKGGEAKLWIPFLVMALLFMVYASLNLEEGLFKKRKGFVLLPIAIVLLFSLAVNALSYKDANFKTEIQLLKAADQEDWNKILTIAGKQKEEPTRLIVMTTNLALFKLNLAGDDTYHYRNGDKEINAPRLILPIHMAGPIFYFQYGIPTYCTKWCMEGMVEYGLNVSFLRYFVLSSILSGETALAQKYNNVLMETYQYKTWAKNHQRFIDHPERIAESTEFRNIIPLTEFNDVLNEDYYNLESFLRIHYSTMTEVPKELTELSVLFNMDIKDDKRFWPRLFRWVKLHPNQRIPTHFQEAALLYADLTKMDITGAPFDANVTTSFKNFLRMVQQYGNYPESAMKEAFAPVFGKTYWYYYFFLKGPQSEKPKDSDYKN